MGIHIGDNNKIQNSIIAEKIKTNKEVLEKRSLYQRHPVVCGFLISLAAGIILLFSFWGNIISFLEGLF